jgi:hypothetical protein
MTAHRRTSGYQHGDLDAVADEASVGKLVNNTVEPSNSASPEGTCPDSGTGQ